MSEDDLEDAADRYIGGTMSLEDYQAEWDRFAEADAQAQVQAWWREEDWEKATDPRLPDSALTPAQLAYRGTLYGSTWRLRRAVDNVGTAIHASLPKPLRRFFDWYGGHFHATR